MDEHVTTCSLDVWSRKPHLQSVWRYIQDNTKVEQIVWNPYNVHKERVPVDTKNAS